MSAVFLSHPYHRGGVTQWMANSFNAWNEVYGGAFFVTVDPLKPFISSGGKPLIADLTEPRYAENIFRDQANYLFELGTVEYRADTYKNLIENNVKINTPVIPSDDEACWMAAASISKDYPVIGILHSDESIYYQLADRYKEYVSLFVCVSKRIQKKVLLDNPTLETKTIVVPCGIFLNEFSFNELKEDRLTWIGRVSRYQKRAQDILPLFELVHTRFPALHLTVLGDGDYMEQICNDVEARGLTGSVSTRGWVDRKEIRKTLATTGIFIQTSDFEGTSVALMEALASGCRVVSTRVSGVEDLEDLESANDVILIYEPGDLQRAAEHILFFLNHHTHKVCLKARKLATEHFDIYRNNQRIMEGLRELKKGGRSPQLAHSLSISKLQLYLSPLLAGLRICKWKVRSLFKS